MVHNRAHTCPWGVEGVLKRQGVDTTLHCGNIWKWVNVPNHVNEQNVPNHVTQQWRRVFQNEGVCTPTCLPWSHDGPWTALPCIPLMLPTTLSWQQTRAEWHDLAHFAHWCDLAHLLIFKYFHSGGWHPTPVIVAHLLHPRDKKTNYMIT